MIGTTALRSGGKHGLLLAVCLWLVLAPTVATAGTVAPGGSSGVAVESATADAGSTLAGSTTVRLEPTTASVDEGATRTLNVVVADTDGGVGAVSGELSIVESEYVEFVDFEFRGDPGLANVSVTGDSVAFEGALMDTPQTGAVAVAEVTVRGELEGTTDLALSIDSLGDESGDRYDVGGTPDAAVSVENTRNLVGLSITADADGATVGESVAFTVMRSDSDARVEANVTVGDRTVSTGVDGEATVVVRESMLSDAGTITAVASKQSTSQERYENDSVTLSVDDSSGSDGGTDDGATSDGDGVIVRTEPGSVDLSAGQRTTVGVVVVGSDGGVGAGDVTVTVADPDVATIASANVTGDPGIGEAMVGDGGASAAAEFALRDGRDEAPVRVLEITLRGGSAGSTSLSLSVGSLGDESGTSYEIDSVPDAGVTVREEGSSGGETTTPESTTDEGGSNGTTVDDGSNATTDEGGSNGTATVSEPTSATTTGGGTQSSDSSDDGPTGDPSIPSNPSMALLAASVVVVLLLGLLLVAAS
jgi:hypothetical protein